MNISRPLAQEELAQRREKARLKHSEMISKKEKDEISVTTTTQSEPTNTTVEHSAPQTTNQNDGTSELPEENSNSDERPDQFIAFARVYSGVIKKGQKLFVLGPKHQPEDVVKDESEDVGDQIYSP